MSKENLTVLREERAAVWEDMQELNDHAEKFQDGNFTDEMQAKWDECEEKITRYDERIERGEKIAEREERYAKPQAEQADATLEAEPTREEERDEREERLEQYIRGEYRAMQADLDSKGGFLVAPQFSSDLIRLMDDRVFMRSLATTYDLSTGDSLTFPREKTDVEDSTWQGEITSANEETAHELDQITLEPRKSAKLIKVSMDLIADSAFDIVQYVQGRFAYKFGITEEKAFIEGSGANQPLGVFTASDSGISTDRDLSTDNTSSTIEADNLFRQTGNIKPQYLDGATWLFHRDAINQIRRLKDGNGQYLLQTGLASGQPNTILGLPYVQSEYVPKTFTSDLYVGLLGNFSAGYYIVTKMGFSMQRLDELYARTHQVGFIGRMRVDGMPVLEEAFTRVKLG